MTYSSFMSAWGPGPEIAKRFKEQSGVTVEFQDAGDAGLILEKLKLFPVDVVVGLDALTLEQARRGLDWAELRLGTSDGTGINDEEPGVKWREREFIPIDHAPLAFVYRKGEVVPPTSLADLLDARFKGAIALEDPRTSTPGLQFLLWTIEEFGEDGAFEFLAKLKPNIHTVSPNWSTAYGAFKKKRAKIVFSYMTSPAYHEVEEKDLSYSAAVFAKGHPEQMEFAGIPAACSRCVDAEKFVSMLRSRDTQTLIMQKNYMLPMSPHLITGAFSKIPRTAPLELTKAGELLKRRTVLFERWRQLGL